MFSSIRKYLKDFLIQPVNHNVINDDFKWFHYLWLVLAEISPLLHLMDLRN